MLSYELYFYTKFGYFFIHIILYVSGTVLKSLLSIEATRSADYPTIEELISDPFFANAIANPASDPLDRHVSKKQYLKISSNVKEALQKHKEAYEKRLQEDFKQVILNIFYKII